MDRDAVHENEAVPEKERLVMARGREKPFSKVLEAGIAHALQDTLFFQ